MLDPYLNLFRVNPEDGSLLNTDGLFEIEALGENGATKFLEQGKVFQGGNWLHLQAMLETTAGEEIMYVGDHLYADVLRSKRTLGWRSCFVMPELEDEMSQFYANKDLAQKITDLRRLRDELIIYAEEIRRTQDVKDPEVQETLEELAEEDAAIKQTISELAHTWHQAFHPVWGAMFNAGYQDSRFAFYVNNYACLYTSRATNLGLASTERAFRTTLEIMPHDRLLSAGKYVDTNSWEDEKEETQVATTNRVKDHSTIN